MKVLIVEDEAAFCQVVVEQFVKSDIEATGVGTGREALERMETDDFDVVVTDLRLPDIDGISVIQQCRESGNETPFLLMTAFASIKTAISALKSGASDYLIKPIRINDLIRRVEQIYDLNRLQRENTVLKRIIRHETKKYWFADTPLNDRIQALLTKVSSTDLTVLLTGESGTGKGMMARLIHSASTRNDGPFISVNCGAIPENLVESELFGHVKGAFTGADKNHDGLFVAAEGGILFLDEIGDLPLPTQVKLLHVLEEKVVRPVGSSKERKVNNRIIAATNRDLDQLVKENRFRNDLYFRLNVVQIPLPALREQRDSLPGAVEFFVEKYQGIYGISETEIDPEVMDLFRTYPWPGNYRELDNVMERALLLCNNGHVTLADLPVNMLNDELSGDVPAVGDFRERVQNFEKNLIHQAIKVADGDRRAAAAELGIGLSTLYRKLEE